MGTGFSSLFLRLYPSDFKGLGSEGEVVKLFGSGGFGTALYRGGGNIRKVRADISRRLCRGAFDLPGFKIGEVTDVTVLLPSAAFEIEADLDLVARFVLIGKRTLVLGQLEFDELFELVTVTGFSRSRVLRNSL